MSTASACPPNNAAAMMMTALSMDSSLEIEKEAIAALLPFHDSSPRRS
jgi:hypothetical protein